MSGLFEIHGASLPGLRIIERTVLADDRGNLERLFCADDLGELIGDATIAQINRTLTRRRGTVRGMHFQLPPHAEIKFVTCLKGRVFDVAVDLRRNSPTFLRWHAEVLSDAEHLTMFIPVGFAHGYQTLADDCELLYVHTAAYEPAAEGAVNPQDPALAIAWPEVIADMSARDASHPMLPDDYVGITP